MIDENFGPKAYHEAQALKNIYPRIEIHFAYLGLSVSSGKIAYLLESGCRKFGLEANFVKDRELLPRRNVYETVTYAWSINKLKKLLKTLNPDIIHTFAPYQNFIYTSQANSETPVVHDAEDLVATDKKLLTKIYGMRYTDTLLEIERKVLLSADGIVFPTQREYDTLHEFKSRALNKVFIFPYVSKSLLPRITSRLTLSEMDGEIHTTYIGSIWFGGYRDVLNYLIELSRMVHVHIYLTNYWHYRIFRRVKSATQNCPMMHLHKSVPFDKMTQTIQIYDYGLVPYPSGHLKLELTFGMKTLEYLYASLLPLFRNPEGFMSNLNNEKVIGYVLKKAKEVLNINPREKKRLLNNFDRVFHLMETHISRLYDLYQSVMD